MCLESRTHVPWLQTPGASPVPKGTQATCSAAGPALPCGLGQTTRPGFQMLGPCPNFTTVAQALNKALPTSEPQFPTHEMKVTTNASPLPSLPDLSGRRTQVGVTVPEWAHLDPGSQWASTGSGVLSPQLKPPHKAPFFPQLAGAPHIPPYSHPAWNPSVGQEGQESPGGWVQLVG